MISKMPFLIEAGSIPDDSMNTGSLALARLWGGELISFSIEESPNEVICSLPSLDGLVRLRGDAAITNVSGGSWLEALAAWRIPVILVAMPLPSGHIPGAAYAYVALCKQLSVPLVGILQLEGPWKPQLRRLDGLPWCGHIPSDAIKVDLNNNDARNNTLVELHNVIYNLKSRYFHLTK
ncbi:hypothetical protein [Prochlorococcus marinus]|uniref:Uncharacterized protein n=1 Tax=Prochlorococcus marinus (strain MIT 9211) TaxID=93059 RepID=A9BB27_PROM4|nr:hypothetical protein [Prochlorococcus marinus]ABX09039.1 Hypothetical protein P9211_11081 [Prochlorococcus marinus str. MIT 9211]